MFLFGTPKPAFQPGDIARLKESRIKDGLWLAVTRRRFVRPTGESTTQWVYDGRILGLVGGELAVVTYGSTFLESSLAPIPAP